MQDHCTVLWSVLNSNKYKYRVYLFLNRPRTCAAISYQIGLGVLILTCIILTIFMSRRDDPFSYRVIFWFDLALTIIFGLEYFIRLWASTSLVKYRGLGGFIRLFFHPITLLDLFVLGTAIAVLVFDVRETMLAVGLRGFRMLHFFENRYHLWRLLGSVVWSQRFQLAVVAYFCLVWLFIIAFMVYFIEAPSNREFTTVANSMWFTLVTFTTVGYGDVVPISTPGKIVTSIGMIIGVSIFAMPGGIIGAGLALKVEEDDNSKPMNLRPNLAASMVQHAWRIFWIKKRLERQNPNQRLGIQMSFNKRTIRFLSISSTTSASTYVNPYAVLFAHYLRFLIAKKRFKFSMFLCDSTSFYETYTHNTLTYNQIFRNIKSHMDRLEELIGETHQTVEQIYQAKIAGRESESKTETEDRVKRIKRPRRCTYCTRYLRCWPCLQRKRLTRMRQSARAEAARLNDEA